MYLSMNNNRKRLIALCSVLLLAAPAFGQFAGAPVKNYYENVDKVQASDGTVFLVTSHAEDKFFMLKIADNIYRDYELNCHKDGTPVNTMEEIHETQVDLVDKDSFTRVLQKMFNDTQILELRRERWPMTVFIFVNPDDGTVFDCSFFIKNIPVLVSQSPDFYVRFNRLIREEVKWTANEAARKLLFVNMAMPGMFAHVPLSSELQTDQKPAQKSDIPDLHVGPTNP